jgi:hypothetical protein
MRNTLYLIGMISLLSGCRTFTPPMEWPVFEQHAQKRVNAFSAIPSRRMVLVKRGDSSDRDTDKILICGEASADVTDNLTSTLAASLSASGGASAEKASASAAFSKALETSAQFLFRRTQGIQLYRDGMYYLCQARMNRFIDDSEYKDRAAKLLQLVVPMIENEIPLMQGSQSTKDAKNNGSGMPGVNATAGNASASASREKANANSEAQKPGVGEKPKDKPEKPKDASSEKHSEY